MPGHALAGASIPAGMVEPGWEDHFRSAIFKIAETDFEDGLKMLDAYIAKFPRKPEGYFFYAAGVQEKIQKLNNLADLERFKKYAGECRKICKDNLAKKPGDTVSRMYLGAVNGYAGLLEARQRNLFRAFMDAVEAKGDLERAMAERPDLADVQFGLGMVYYFASRKGAEEGGAVAWVITKFITQGRDMRKEALEMIRRPVEAGTLSEDYARAALMWISLYEKKYDRARELAEYISKKFTRDAGSRWVKGRLAYLNGDYAEARRMFSESQEILRKRGVAMSRYKDLEIAIKFTEMRQSMDRRQWDGAEDIRRAIDDWLSGEPKISMEYQDEKNLLGYWRSEADNARKSMTFVTGGK